MKAFLAAVAAMVLITAAAPPVMDQLGYTAAATQAGTSVRLD